jgi:hypothetical protein
MRFARAFGGRGDAPGQFTHVWGVAVVRGLLVVSEIGRLQVLTPQGVPLQVLTLGDVRPSIYMAWRARAAALVRGLCADEQRGHVHVTGLDQGTVHALKLRA